MSDLISRQAALEVVRSLQTYKMFAGDDTILVDKAEVQAELEILPTARERWIPCEEEFPPPNTAVLAYAPRFGNIWAVYYDSICGWMVWSPVGDAHFPEGQGEIIAWMPMPEPYKGEEK